MMTQVDSPITEFVLLNATRLPMLIVCIVGMVMALATKRRHPTASLLSLIAFVIFLTDSILNAAFVWYVVRGDFNARFGRAGLLLIGNVVFTGMNLTGWILILIALFARRPRPTAWPRGEPEQYAAPNPEHNRPTPPMSENIQK